MMARFFGHSRRIARGSCVSQTAAQVLHSSSRFLRVAPLLVGTTKGSWKTTSLLYDLSKSV